MKDYDFFSRIMSHRFTEQIELQNACACCYFFVETLSRVIAIFYKMFRNVFNLIFFSWCNWHMIRNACSIIRTSWHSIHIRLSCSSYRYMRTQDTSFLRRPTFVNCFSLHLILIEQRNLYIFNQDLVFFNDIYYERCIVKQLLCTSNNFYIHRIFATQKNDLGFGLFVRSYVRLIFASFVQFRPAFAEE